MICAECGEDFAPVIGKRGRPRVRCFTCWPAQIGLPNTYRRRDTSTVLCASPACSNTFLSNGIRIYCDDKCGYAARPKPTLDQQRTRYLKASPKNYSPRICAWCSQPFTSTIGDLRRRYCSTHCKRAFHWKAEGGSNYRRRARKFGVAYQAFDKRLVFERDGWKCQICNVSTPKHLSGTLKANAPQLDHIVALSNGGAHSLENTQCACRRCNMKKLDGPPVGQVGLFTALVNETIKTKRRRASPQT